MGNTAKSVLRGKLRVVLNEPTDAMFTNAALNQFMQDALNHYGRIYLSRDPQQANRYEDISYPAGSESYDITTSGYSIAFIKWAEDRTSIQPGTEIRPFDSFQDMKSAQTFSESNFVAPGYYFQKEEDGSGGVNQTIYLAPNDIGKSLRLHVQAEPQILTAEDDTTLMPDSVERCILLQAALDARMMEESPNVGLLQTQLAKAEMTMLKQVASITRGPAAIRFHSVD